MPLIDLPHLRLHYEESGTPSGAPVIFAPGLGMPLALWEEVVAALPQHYRLIRFDLRGQGHSDAPPGPWSMGALVRDAEALMVALSLREAVFVGHGLGGMIGQALAVKRLDLVRALVLSGTATKLGTVETWAARAELVRAQGVGAGLAADLAKAFPRFAQKSAAAARAADLQADMRPESFLALCGAIAGADFYATTARLTLPALVLAGVNDGVTPPDLVLETARLMRGADERLLRRSGHYPQLDAPAEMAAEIAAFLARIGHDRPQATAPASDACGCGSPHDHHHPHHHGEGCC